MGRHSIPWLIVVCETLVSWRLRIDAEGHHDLEGCGDQRPEMCLPRSAARQ
jgi:hypothetical protein